MSSNEIAIKAEGLSKRYEIYDQPGDRLKQFLFPSLRNLFRLSPKQYFREFWALRDISFEVKRGETVGIIGRNGSGKSTLLQIICGTLAPASGSVSTSGRIAALLELGSGFNPEFTGRENVYLNASVLGLASDEINSRFEDIVSFSGIGDFIDQPIKTYSSGMLVRLAFAVIAHVDADILVIDEALAVGDAFFTQKCMRFLRSFMKNGTILFVSHDTASIKNLCTSALWIESGVVVKQGSPKEVTEHYLQAFYEAQQGAGGLREQKIEEVVSDISFDKEKDFRLEEINTSKLRNNIRFFEFNPDAKSFGRGAATVISVALLDFSGTKLSWITGGEKVILRVIVSIDIELNSPIVGFFIKDRLGQNLFGDNTYLASKDAPLKCDVNSNLQVDFVFNMPILPVGDYSITVAVAEGTQENHIQHQWMHDALLFRSETSSVSCGLVGIPMQKITMTLTSKNSSYI